MLWHAAESTRPEAPSVWTMCWIGHGLDNEYEKTHSWVILKLLRPTLPVDAGESDSKLSECACKHIQEVLILRENNRFGTWIVLMDPQNMASQSVNLGPK